MIKLERLTKRFGDTTVLDGIDLEIQQGEIIVVIGPSGTGKSTLLRCLNFLEQPDGGRLTLGPLNLNLTQASKSEILAARRHTAFVFQNYALFANKTALENIAEGLIVVNRWSKDRAHARAREILERIGLADNWLYHLRDVQERYAERLDAIPDVSLRHARLCELNVVEQVRNVTATTIVRNAWQRGQPLSVQEVDLAEPQAGEVLVRLVACGVCHPDLYTASGADPTGYAPEAV